MQDSSNGRNAVEVLAEEFVERYRRGEYPPLSEYTSRFPDLANEIRDLFPAMLLMENLKPAAEEVAAGKKSGLELRQLGDYRIIREVGRGGMGVVYEAEQVSLGRHVALKVLPRDMVANPKQRLRFEREAKAAAKLHHTNIVPVFGVGDSDGQLYYVMQFIQGSALDDVLEELKRLKAAPIEWVGSVPAREMHATGREVSGVDLAQSLLVGSLPQSAGKPSAADLAREATCIVDGDQPLPAESVLLSTSRSTITGRRSDTFSLTNSSVVLPKKGLDSGANASPRTTYCESIALVGVQVARALEYAHSQGVLHRDIKPANLVLDLKGTVWVTDFGLAKLDDDRGLTQVGDILGTLRYMSPETFKGQADARSEVYSLGLTLYEMLAFRPAFDQFTRSELVEQVMHAQVEQLRKLNPEVPSDLQTIIHKAIERDPADRYQTAGELADDLQRFFDDTPIKARRVSPLERLVRWSRHNKSLAASLAVVTLLVSVLAIGSAVAAGYFQSVNSELSKTIGKLTDTTSKLTAANEKANIATKDAEKKAADARSAEQQAQTILADMQTERGQTSIEQGDQATAMLWFANAASYAGHDSQRRAANRLRARNAMNNAMLPVALLRHAVSGLNVRTAFQPHGELLLALNAGRLQIWNWHLEQTLPWTDNLRDVIAAKWSADGNKVAIGFAAGSVQIRAVPSGEVIRQWTHPERVESLSYSRDGRQLAVGSNVVHVWDVSGEPKLIYRCPHPAPVHSMTFDSNGTRLATSCRDLHARLFALPAATAGSADISSETELSPAWSAVSHAPQLETPAVFVDGDRRFVTIHHEDRIGYWDVETGAPVELASSAGSLYGAREVVASPDGRWFAVAGNTPALWNVDGKRYPLAHGNHMRCAAFSPDGALLATGCDDWITRLWNVPPSSAPRVSVPQMKPVLQSVFSDDGAYVAACSVDVIRVWKRPESGQAVVGFGGGELRHSRPRPSFDQRWITAGAWHETPNTTHELTSTLSVVDAATGRPAGPAITVSNVFDSCICGDNRSVAAISLSNDGGTLSFYDVASGRPSCQPFVLPGPPCSVAARPGHPDVAVLCRSGQIVIVNQQNGHSIRNISTRSWDGDELHARLTYTADGRALIALLPQNEVVVYDARTGIPRYAPIRPQVAAGGRCRTFAVSADGRWLATAVNGQNTVQVWDLATGKPVGKPLPHPGDQYGIFTVVFSPDGGRLMSGNKDGRARLWNWRTGKLMCPPLQHADEVYDSAFTSDGRYAVTAVRHGTLRVWELQTGKLIAPPVDYPLPPMHSSVTVAIVGEHAVVGALNWPIVSLRSLLTDPTVPTESLQTVAELATARRLVLGELSGLSDTEWTSLWSGQRDREFTPGSLAATFARDLDKTSDAVSRAMIAARAAKSEAVLEELGRLRDSIPQVQAELASTRRLRGDASAVPTRDRAIALYEQQLTSRPHDQAIAGQLVELLIEAIAPKWKVLELSELKSRAGAQFGRRGDGAIVVSGKHAVADVYTLTTTGNGDPVAVIRLEALIDSSLPGGGPGRHSSGNFQFSAFQLFRSAMPGDDSRPLAISAAHASYAYQSPDVDVLGLIRPERKQIWHVWGRPGQPHQAVFIPERPLTVDRQHPLIISWRHNDIGEAINLGCFRVSASNDPQAYQKEQELLALRHSPLASSLSLASVYILGERYDRALELLTRIPDDRTSNTSGARLLLLAEIHQRTQQPDLARARYDELLTWLQTNDLPESLQIRAVELQRTIGGLTAEQIARQSRQLLVNRQIRQLTKQIERGASDPNVYFQRAELYARVGDWREAAADHLKVVELIPEERLTYLPAAAALLFANDRDGYRDLCRRLVTRFRSTTDSLQADTACKLSLLVPGTIPLAELPTVTLLEGAKGQNQLYQEWLIACSALVKLREDRFQEALDMLQRLGDAPSDASGALALVIRSMALHHLNQSPAARQSLNLAEGLIHKELRDLGTSSYAGPVPVEADIIGHDWLIAEFLRREAESLIKLPADPQPEK